MSELRCAVQHVVSFCLTTISYNISGDIKLRYHTLHQANMFGFLIFEFVEKFSYKVDTAVCRLFIVELSSLLLLCQCYL